MAFKILFDGSNHPIEPTFVLANRSGNKLGALTNVCNITVNGSIDTPEVMFEVHKYDNGVECNLWDQIKNFKLLYCKDWDFWFEITIEVSSNDGLTKSVVGTALCQAELSQVMLYDIEINTENDILREEYTIPTTVYNEKNKEASLLNRITGKVPHYTIDHVDTSLKTIQRTFTFDDISLKDALDEIAEEINCIVVYGNGTKPEKENGIYVPQRTISLYDLESICGTCGYRGDFVDVCPQCGGKEITNGYGEDTTIFVSKDNLTDEITLAGDVDSVKNCFKLEAGDDLMTATVQNCNPNGSGYLWHITEEMKSDMPSALVEKLNEYDASYNVYLNTYECPLDNSLIQQYNNLISKYSGYNETLVSIKTPIVGYPALMNNIYNMIDFDLYLTDVLMPIGSLFEVTAQSQADLLVSGRMSPIAVTDTQYMSAATAESNALAMAKIIVSSNYRVKVKDSAFDKAALTWTGSFNVTNYYDDEDTADSGTVKITFDNDFKRFVEQKVADALHRGDTEDYSITDIMKQELTVSGDSFSGEFMTTIAGYSLHCLQSMYYCCQGCLDVLIEQGIGDDESWSGSEDEDLYNTLYVNYYNKQNALAYEISVRENEINTIENLMENAETVRTKIQMDLDMENFLGADNWKLLSSYRRDDTYSNSNYVSDGLTNAELFNNALKFIEVAEKDIRKASEIQYTIDSTLNNLLVIDEFKKLVDYFEVGNWIRIEVDGNIYKLRLINYTIDYEDLENLSVEFSDVTDIKSNVLKLDGILAAAQSMSSSFDHLERQAEKGKDANDQLQDWVDYGLAATATKIMNSADEQDVIFDSHGMLFRRYDNFIEDYLPTQLKIINSTLAVTDDNWKTTKAAIGKFIYLNPMTRKIESAFGINGELVIGKLILGEQLGIYNPTATLTFNNNGLKITNGTNSVTINPNSDELFVITHGQDKILWVATDGSLNINGNGNFTGTITSGSGHIGGWTITENSLYRGSNTLGQAGNANTYLGSAGLSMSNKFIYNATTGSLTVDRITATNLTVESGTFKGTLSGATGTFSGSLNAATGTFAGELQAASGTFTGKLEAATGSFSGSLNAATGTFAGELKAASGTFTGKLEAATGSFSGSITANEGHIGGINGFTIATGKIYSGTHSSYNSNVSGVYIGTDYIALGANGAIWFKSDGTFSLGNGDIKSDGSKITLSDITLSWDSITGKPDLSDSHFTQITKNTVTSAYVAGLAAEFESGKIGGWTIADSRLYASTSYGGRTYAAVMQVPSTSSNWIFAAGGTSTTDCSTAPFRVRSDGSAFMEKCIITNSLYMFSSTFNYNYQVLDVNDVRDRLVIGRGYTEIYSKCQDTNLRPFIGTEVDFPAYAIGANDSNDTFRVYADWSTGKAVRTISTDASDIRLKENIKPTTVEALPIISKICVRQFDWKKTEKHQSIGFIADELEEIDPKFAIGGGYESDGTMNTKSVDTFYLLGYAIKAIQELNDKVEQLSVQLQQMEEG